MTVRWVPCTACIRGVDTDGRVCWWCDGALGETRPALPVRDLVCGHTVGASLRLARHHCAACAMDVEVVDPARLDDQRARFADEIEARASELEVAPLWGWPEPPRSERARLHEERVEALIRMRRVAGAMRARVGSKQEAA